MLNIIIIFFYKFTLYSYFSSSFKAIDYNIASVAANFPTWCQCRVQYKNAMLTLDTTRYTQSIQGMRAGGMSTGIATGIFRHFPERRIVVTVGTEGIRSIIKNFT